MMNNRPDVTDEDIGMRTFQIKKARAVERAIERLRSGLKSDWPELTTHEIEELEWILGELWAYAARDEWQDLRFGNLSMHDVRTILKYGRELRKHSRNAVDILNDVAAVVRAKG
jgi:hypothetical protein